MSSNLSKNSLNNLFTSNNRHPKVSNPLLLSKAATIFSLWGKFRNFVAPISTAGPQRIAPATRLCLGQKRGSQRAATAVRLYSVQNRESQRCSDCIQCRIENSRGLQLRLVCIQCRIEAFRGAQLRLACIQYRIEGRRGALLRRGCIQCRTKGRTCGPGCIQCRIEGRTAARLYALYLVQSWRLYSAQNRRLREGPSCDTAVFSTEPRLDGPRCRI